MSFIKWLFFIVFEIYSIQIFSQSHNTFELISKGAIPEYFCIKPLDLYNSKKDSITETNNKIDTKWKFYIESDFSLRFLISNGKVLFGDSISQFLNLVADKLLSQTENSNEEVRVFCLKSCSMNAISTSQGFIFVNIGLISRLDNEGELAYVIAHELAHYLKKHPVNSYIYKTKLNNEHFFRKGITNEEQIRIISKQSRELELEADSIAINMVLKAGYSYKSILSALDKLNYSNLPISQIKFDQDFFNDDSFFIPKCFYKNSLTSIVFDEEYEDSMNDHPNISKRKESAKKILENISYDENQDLAGSTNFLRIKNLSCFELARLQLVNQEYADAIYNSFVLLQSDPENKYLQLIIAKALYGLSEYKSENMFHKIAKPYTRSQGESQQVHYVIKQLTKKQLNTLSLRYVYNLKKLGFEDKILDKMEAELIKNLIFSCNLSLDDFYIDSLVQIPPPEKDFYLDDERKILEEQRRYQDFYKTALTIPLKDSDFIKLFQYYESLKLKNKSLSTEDLETKSNSRKTIVLCNISYFEFDKESNINPIQSEKVKPILINKIERSFLDQGDIIETLSFSSLIPDDIEKYNKLCNYQEAIQELAYNYKIVPLYLGGKEFREANTSLLHISLKRAPQMSIIDNFYYSISGDGYFSYDSYIGPINDRKFIKYVSETKLKNENYLTKFDY